MDAQAWGSRTLRLSPIAAALVVTLTGCDRCTPEDPPPPPPTLGESTLDPNFLGRVPAPREDAAVALWKAAARDGWGEPTTAATEPVRWRVPSCPLRYVLRSHHLYEVTEEREPAGQSMRASIAANPGDDGLTLQVTEVATAVVADGERGTPTQHATVGWALPQVKTDGLTWTEKDGPTTVWSAYGTVPALVGLFPALPRATAVGGKVKWGVEIFLQRTTQEIERRRAEGKPAPTVAPIQRERDLEVKGFIDLGGETAMILTGSWTMEVDVRDRMLLRRAERWRGHFVVIPATGRLLHAALVGRSLQEMELESRDRKESEGRGEIELRLVEACDGPTLPDVPALKAGPI